MELRGKQEEDDQPIYEEEGIRAINEDQSLTLSLSTLLHPSVFSCFSPMRKTGGGSRDEGIRFYWREKAGEET